MQNQVKKSKRNSAIELLRIVAMFMIIISHYSVHGVINADLLPFSLNKIILQASVLGNLGVAIFVIITGYYGIKNEFNIKKIIYFYFQVWFYSVIIYILLVIFGVNNFSVRELITCMFPIIFKKYWFMTAYLLLSIFTPFINKLLNSLNNKQYTIYLFLLIAIWFLIPTFARQQMYGGEFMLFVTFYSLGAYIKIFDYKFKKTSKRYIVYSMIMYFILLASIVSIDYIKGTSGIAFMYNNSLFILLLAIFIFLSFAKSKPYSNGVINKISACTLGIYLIHDNDYIRSLLWKSVVKNNLMLNSPFLFLDIIKWGIIVFVVCALIELIRINIIHKPFVKIIDKYINKIIEKIKNSFNKFMNISINKE